MMTARPFSLTRRFQALANDLASRLIFTRKPSSIVIAAVAGFIISIASLNSIYIGDNLSQLGSAEFLLENTVPLTYWIGLILLVSPLLLVKPFWDDRTIPGRVLFSSILLMTCMRAILPLTVLKPFDIDVHYYIGWMEAWLREGIQLVPGNLIKTPLLYYYPNTHPVAFLLAYIFLKMGVPIDFFFKWAPFALYGIDLCLVYLVSKEINGGYAELAALSAFLAAPSSMAQVITLFYSPHLLGSALLLLCLYLFLRMSDMRVRRMQMLVLCATAFIGVLLLILTHALGTLYFIAAVGGLVLLGWFLKVSRRGGMATNFSAVWPILAVAVWFVCANVLYPQKFQDWVTSVYQALMGQFLHGYHAVTLTNLLGMGWIDKLSFLSYPSLILGLAMCGIVQIKGRKLADPVLMKTLGLVGLLGVLSAFGLTARGMSYPLRIIEVISILCCPLAAKALAELLSPDRPRVVRSFAALAVVAVVLLSTHWMFRAIQRLVY